MIIVVEPSLRGGMRKHSRGVVAAVAGAAFIAAMAFSMGSPVASPAWARIHHRWHGPQVPGSGTHAGDEANSLQAEAGGTGKTGLPSSLGAKDFVPILGKNVHSSTGEDMGRLVDVIVDTEGRPRAAIIDFGGFLGVGSRKIAVDWSVLKFVPGDPKGNLITVALTRDQVKAAPEFKEGSPLVALGATASPPPASPPPQAREK
jgi:hypothetical protein